MIHRILAIIRVQFLPITVYNVYIYREREGEREPLMESNWWFSISLYEIAGGYAPWIDIFSIQTSTYRWLSIRIHPKYQHTVIIIIYIFIYLRETCIYTSQTAKGGGKGPAGLQTGLHGARKRPLLDLQVAIHSQGGTPIAGRFIRIVYGKKNLLKWMILGPLMENLYIWKVCRFKKTCVKKHKHNMIAHIISLCANGTLSSKTILLESIWSLP